MQGRRIWRGASAVLGLCCGLFNGIVGVPDTLARDAPDASAHLVYVSNLPDIARRPGLAEVASLVEALRGTGNEVRLLHGGDSLAPSILSAFDRGAHMIALLNTLEPMAMGVAKREFAFGEDELTLRTFEASFPLVANNLHDPATGDGLEGIESFARAEVASHTLCVTAALSSELNTSYMPVRVYAEDAVDSTRRLAAGLRAEGCSTTIALFGATDPGQALLLEDGSVDMVIRAESHVENRIERKHGLLVTLKATDSSALVIDLGDPATESCVLCDARLVPLADIEGSATVGDRIASYRAKLEDFLAVPVGITETELDTRREIVRTQEAAFGNLVADALRSAFNADVAIVNAGGIRGSSRYPKGTVLTWGDLQGELPFRNRIILLEVTGEQLLSALENGFAGLQDQSGAFPQVSGLTLTFDPEAPAGSRVADLRIAGQAVDRDSRYSLATIEFLARGGDGYTSLVGARRLRTGTNTLAWETVRAYVQDNSPVAPAVEGRLRVRR